MHDPGLPDRGAIRPHRSTAPLGGLDVWFEREVQPRLRGVAFLVRYADDFVIVCAREDDARRVLDVLPKRFGRYGLILHPEKTRLVPFVRPLLGDRVQPRAHASCGARRRNGSGLEPSTSPRPGAQDRRPCRRSRAASDGGDCGERGEVVDRALERARSAAPAPAREHRVIRRSAPDATASNGLGGRGWFFPRHPFRLRDCVLDPIPYATARLSGPDGCSATQVRIRRANPVNPRQPPAARPGCPQARPSQSPRRGSRC